METKERIINLLAEKLGYEKAEINENQDLINDLGIDSLDMVEIIIGVEEEFGLKIDDKEVDGIKTVEDLIKKADEWSKNK